MSRYPGGIITKNPITPAGPNPTGAAPGVWRLNDVAYWRKQGLWPDASADRYWPYTSLLLSTTALGNANNNLFVDSSGAFNPVSRNGNTTQGSFTPYGSYWSNYFDGSGDYLSAPSNSAFGFGTGAYTVEFWVNFNALGGQELVKTSSGFTAGCWTIWYSGGQVQVVSVGGAGAMTYNWTTATTGQWYHIAVSRDGSSNQALFINGTRVANGTYTNNFAQDGLTVAVGNSASFNGYMSNLRMVKGTAVYDPTQSTITVPTTPLTAISGTSLLTCQSNRFIDNSSNAFAITVNGDTKVQKFSPFTLAAPGVSYNQSDITNWSGYFDGSGDYLTTPTLATIGSGDFSQEAWVFASSTSGTPLIWDAGVGAGTFLLINGTTSILGGINGTTALTATYTLPTNQWTHLVYCRSGTTLSIYANGTRIATGTVSTSAASASYNIGAAKDVTRFFTGYISNLRFVTGSSAYDATQATITVPTTSLTAISGTSLLTLQNAAFTDNSTNNFVITQNGNPTVTGNSPFNTVGYWSNYFDGNDYIQTPDNAAFAFGTGDYTVEAWVYPTSIRNGENLIYVTEVTQGLAFGYNQTQVYIGARATAYDLLATYTMPTNQWVHVAATRQSGTARIFVNGTQVGSGTITRSNPQGPGTVGDYTGGSNGNGVTGYLSNVRVIKGTALYTSNFTVPTAPLTAVSGTSLLTCQNGRFIDNSTNAYAITRNGDVSVQPYNPFYTATIASNGGSMYFDGSGDYLSVPSSPGLNFGTSNWTIECWVYVSTRTTNYPLIFGNNRGSWTTDALALTASNADSASYNDKFVFAWNNGGFSSPSAGTSQLLVANATNDKNTWYHFAVVRNGTSVLMFRNGVQVANATVSSGATFNWGYNGSLLGGGNWDGAQGYFNGYISNLRATPSAVYTAAFTPPTAPVTPTAATTLLLNGMNAGIYDATTINDMETVGNAQVSTVQSKFGGSSMYFDGSGDYLVLPATPTIAFGTGAFTVEGWVYVSAYSYNGLFSSWNAAATGVGVLLGLDNAGKPQFSIGNANTGANESITGASAIPLNTWTHLAATKTAGSGGTMRLFVNGVSVGTTTTTRSVERTVAVVGRYYQDTNNYYLNGYIDDLRVTNGVARYTANFTPPTAAFPTY